MKLEQDYMEWCENRYQSNYEKDARNERIKEALERLHKSRKDFNNLLNK